MRALVSPSTRRAAWRLVLLASLPAGCGIQSDAEPLAAVPDSASIVFRADWAQVRQDPKLAPLMAEAGVDGAMQAAGLPRDAVSVIVVFGRVTEPASATAILKGRFGESHIRQWARARGASESRHGGWTIYTDRADDRCLALVGPGLLVAGPWSDVVEVLDVAARRRPPLVEQEDVKRLLLRISQGYPIAALSVVPVGSGDAADLAVRMSSGILALFGLGPIGTVLEHIGTARALGVGLSSEPAGYPVEIGAAFKDDQTAAGVSGALGLLMALGSVVPDGSTDPDTTLALRSLSVSRDAQSVFVKMRLPERSLTR